MLRHYRILKGKRFQGGEWCDAGQAYAWARLHVIGFFVIVECNAYGVPLNQDWIN